MRGESIAPSHMFQNSLTPKKHSIWSIDRANIYRIDSFRAHLLHLFPFPRYEGVKKKREREQLFATDDTT